MAMRQRWARRLAWVLIVAAGIPFLALEVFYQYQLAQLPALPSPASGTTVPPAIAQAVSAGVGQGAELNVRPLWPWDLAMNWWRTRYHRSPDVGLAFANVVAKEWLRERGGAPQPTAWCELALAVWLTRHFSAEQLMGLWAGAVTLPNAGTGLEEVSLYYFGKPAAELRREEAALLVGSAFSSLQFDPYCKPARARERRDAVLRSMERAGVMSSIEARDARAQPVRLAPGSAEPSSCP
ncbi:MAG TPA: transglycosylase domain-containing protein [Myxococcaceae bacterium]|nr:transglycosylase domain-containing protein [Myxococcaceae bacterium]